MLINLEQCQALLVKLEDILKIFEKYKCFEVKLYIPQFPSEQGKINFYIKDNNIAIYDAARLKHELKEVVGREDINIAFDSRTEDEAKIFISSNTVDFTQKALEDQRRKLQHVIGVKEAPEEVVYVTFKVSKARSDFFIANVIDMIEKTDAEEAESNQNFSTPLTSRSVSSVKS